MAAISLEHLFFLAGSQIMAMRHYRVTPNIHSTCKIGQQNSIALLYDHLTN